MEHKGRDLKLRKTAASESTNSIIAMAVDMEEVLITDMQHWRDVLRISFIRTVGSKYLLNRVVNGQTDHARMDLVFNLNGSFTFFFPRNVESEEESCQVTENKTAHAYRASPSTVLTDGIAPSAPSKREQPNVRAAAQPSNPCHRRNQAARTWPSIQGGAPHAFAAAKHLRNTLASADQRPPTSTPNTTNLARPCSPVNSGYVSSFLRLARARDFPFVVAVPR